MFPGNICVCNSQSAMTNVPCFALSIVYYVNLHSVVMQSLQRYNIHMLLREEGIHYHGFLYLAS